MSENHEVREAGENDLKSAWQRIVELSTALDAANAELTMWRDGNILHETHRNELAKVERERDELQRQRDHAIATAAAFLVAELERIVEEEGGAQ
jgi:uncharacterized membrane protein